MLVDEVRPWIDEHETHVDSPTRATQ